MPATGAALVVRQTLALFVDALRRLRAAKLFWVALVLSAIVAGSLGILGINETGLSVPFYGQIESNWFNSELVPPRDFYAGLFVLVGVSLWLAWAANILAVISTADLVPALVADGSVDLYLSRPLGRVQLFLTRYLTGLLFVVLQALCFSGAAAIVFLLRAGVWVPGVFWAVPMIALLFSFLYCVSALTGLLTGSSIVAILVTLLFWMAIFAIDTIEQVVLTQREQSQALLDEAEATVQRSESLADTFANAGESMREMQAANVAVARRQAEAARASATDWANGHRIVMAVKAPLPKTGETVQALQNRLFASADLSSFEQQFADREIEQAQRRAERRAERLNYEDGPEKEAFIRESIADARGQMEASATYAGRPLWWSIGTGIAFEVVIVGLCCLIFWRRDLA